MACSIHGKNRSPTTVIIATEIPPSPLVSTCDKAYALTGLSLSDHRSEIHSTECSKWKIESLHMVRFTGLYVLEDTFALVQRNF